MSEWSHLPNAKYIDRVLAHLKNDPGSWDAAWSTERDEVAWDAARNAAWDAAAWDAAYKAAWDAAWDEVAWPARKAAARARARGAILALIAWDHAGALLELPAEQVRVLALLGQPAAILIYLAVLAMENLPKSLIINKIDLVDQ